MAWAVALLCSILVLLALTASSAVVEYTFNVANRNFRVCGEQSKTVVNNTLPGPVIRANEGDTLIIHVLNNSPENITLHWHGVFQMFSNWADGPAYITQCPIVPETSYTYKFNVTGQEGTLWWHAHISMLRETLYGPIIIQPRAGKRYPFPKPDKEVPILLGEWFNANVVDLELEFINNGGAPRLSDAFTINGEAGNLYPCALNKTYTLNVTRGKTYLLQMINAAMHDHMFFKIAQHTFTVVAVDAKYIEPYNTDVIVISPGQSADVLLQANQPLGDYYMAARVYFPTPNVGFANGTTTAILHYDGAASTTPLMPVLPAFNDTSTAHTFFSNLTSLTTASNPHWKPVPTEVDVNMFITFGLAVEPCGANRTCATPALQNAFRFSSTMNNISFLLPTQMSILQAYHDGISGVYTDDFPDRPPMVFNYTSPAIMFSFPLMTVLGKETRVKRLKYNSVVDVVLQNAIFIAAENHPIHFHGFDFYVLAQGFGNYDEVNDPRKFNLVNPQQRNTIAVPIGGWAAIRFRAINPGVWFVHCHRETHVPWGLDFAFIIEDGPTPETSLPPPPSDFPRC